jgi:gentisate 1,2-dioxygenase
MLCRSAQPVWWNQKLLAAEPSTSIHYHVQNRTASMIEYDVVDLPQLFVIVSIDVCTPDVVCSFIGIGKPVVT